MQDAARSSREKRRDQDQNPRSSHRGHSSSRTINRDQVRLSYWHVPNQHTLPTLSNMKKDHMT